jgi:hypothetical protein
MTRRFITVRKIIHPHCMFAACSGVIFKLSKARWFTAYQLSIRLCGLRF